MDIRREGAAWIRDVVATLRSLVQTAPRTMRLVAIHLGLARSIIYAFCVVAITILPVLSFLALGKLIDGSTSDGPPSTGQVWGLMVIAVVAVTSLVTQLQGSFGQRIREVLWFNTVGKGSEAISIVDGPDAKPEDIDKITRVREHARWRVGQFADSQAMFLLNIGGAIFTCVIAFQLGWWLVWISVAAIIQVAVELSYARADRKRELSQSRTWKKYWRWHWASLDKDSIVENQQNRNTKRFGRRLEWYGEKLRGPSEAVVVRFNYWRLLAMLPALLVLAFATTSLIESTFSAEGTLSAGSLTFLIGGLISFSGALSRMAVSLHQLTKDSLLVGDFFEIIDQAEIDINKAIEFKPESNSALNPHGFGEETDDDQRFSHCPTVEVRGLRYCFESGEENTDSDWALDGVSFRLDPGSKVLVVGPSGNGKTTLIDVLSGAKVAQEGSLLIDGLPVSANNKVGWLDSQGILLQRFFQTETLTIREALAYATRKPMDSFSDEQLWSALERAQAAGFVRKKKGQLDAYLLDSPDRGDESHLTAAEREERWTDLSLGEWQRLKLAGLFLRDPWVYFLDEPTSALDPENSEKILSNLLQLEDRTVLMVTHHLELCRLADRIMVMEDGKIIEEGSPQELEASGKRYNELLAAHYTVRAVENQL